VQKIAGKVIQRLHTFLYALIWRYDSWN